jgi:hypothetical protein
MHSLPLPSQQSAGQRSGPLVALLVTTAALGCGDVHFVPAPFTPQNVELVFSTQEHLTIIRWRVNASAPLAETRFEMLGPDGYQPIDFTRSVFTGGVTDCGDGRGTCAQYVVRGRYPQHLPAGEFRPVRAVHDLYGELPGVPAKSRTVEETFKMNSFFHYKNERVNVNLTDIVGSDGPYSFPRAFEHGMWPTVGLCLADAPPDDVAFATLDASSAFAPETPLTENGTYCVALRPVPADAGSTAMVQKRIATVPEVVTAQHVLNPPLETSPIIYQVILDLEIPVPEVCPEAIAEIERVTSKYMVGQGAAVRKLPTINLARPGSLGCSQQTGPTLAAAEIAEAVKQTVTTYTEVHHQYHLLYFNNLDAPLPATLVRSFKELFAALAGPPPGYDLRTVSWLFNPAHGALSDLQWTNFSSWTSASDPMFEMEMSNYTMGTLPYRTQLHSSEVPVLLLSPEDVQTYAGKHIKICTSSPFIVPVSQVGPYAPSPIVETAWEIKAEDPPAYLVALDDQIAVPANQYVSGQVRVSYQICTRYCVDHGYVAPDGTGPTSWRDSGQCATKDF